jgi:hypothetical protein
MHQGTISSKISPEENAHDPDVTHCFGHPSDQLTICARLTSMFPENTKRDFLHEKSGLSFIP